MKRIFYLILLTILVLQAGGLLLICKLQQGYARFEMSVLLKSPDANFQRLIITATEYQASKIGDGEILYEENRYDVKSISVSGDKVELFVLNDELENNILQAIGNMINGKSNPIDGELADQLQELVSLTYLSADTESIIDLPSFGVLAYYQQHLNVVSNHSDVIAPPPNWLNTY